MIQFDDILKEMLDTHTKKGKDYAAPGKPFGNFEFAATLAESFSNPVDRVFASIIGIKIARLKELASREAVNEPMEDTYKDLAIYCAIWWWYHKTTNNYTRKFTSPEIEVARQMQNSNTIIKSFKEQELEDMRAALRKP